MVAATCSSSRSSTGREVPGVAGLAGTGARQDDHRQGGRPGGHDFEHSPAHVADGVGAARSRHLDGGDRDALGDPDGHGRGPGDPNLGGEHPGEAFDPRSDDSGVQVHERRGTPQAGDGKQPGRRHVGGSGDAYVPSPETEECTRATPPAQGRRRSGRRRCGAAGGGRAGGRPRPGGPVSGVGHRSLRR